MKKRLRIIVPVALAALAVGIGVLFVRKPPDATTLRLSGNIDVTQVDLAFKIAGRVSQRLVDEGDRVMAGQLLAVLEDTDQQLQLKRAAADAAFAAAVLAEREAGSRLQEIAEAEADLKRAKAEQQTAESQLKLTQTEFRRYEAVFKEGGISRHSFDTYRTGLDAARQAAAAARSQRKAAEQRLSLRHEGPREEAIAQARAKKAAALAALATARQQLADTTLVAPFDGVVLSTSAEPGSYRNPGATVLTAGDIRNVWLRVFVSETDLGRIRLGQTATVSVDAYPQRTWQGVVSFISSAAEFTPRSVQTFTERTNLVYRLKIQLDNPDGTLKPGMPADAVIETAP
jgi:HlyD family secretion protein